MTSSRLWLEQKGLTAVGGVLLLFLLLPLFSLFATTSFAVFWDSLRHPLLWPALRLSLTTTVVSLGIVVFLGTPLAWSLTSSRSRAARFLETLVELPMAIPPAVVGVALLLTFGKKGLLGTWFGLRGFSLPFTTSAVILAEVFVSAPFFVQAAKSAFGRIDPQTLIVARSLGAFPMRLFFQIALPLASPGLLAGATMSWARSLGEFGATLMFAGNLEGTTQTLPLAIYTALETDLRAAQTLSLLLVGVAFALLLLGRFLLKRTNRTGDRV